MKFSHTLIGIAAAFASASSESNSNMNMFSTLAESAVDASSWNFDEGKHVCRVYGDPHVLAYNGAKINFAGTGEFEMAYFETLDPPLSIYVTASTFTEPNATEYSYVDQVGFFCGDSKMVTRAPLEVGHTPGIYYYDGDSVVDSLPPDFSVSMLGAASNVVREEGDDVILQTVCSPQDTGVEVELFIKYHVNAFNTPVMNFAIRFALTENIGYIDGMCQSPLQAADEFYGGFFLGNGYCDSEEPIEIKWGSEFQTDDCGPCSYSVAEQMMEQNTPGKTILTSIHEKNTLTKIANSNDAGVDITVPQVPSEGDVCYRVPTPYPTGSPNGYPTGYPTGSPTGYPTGYPTASPVA